MRQTLKSIRKYNHRKKLTDHFNCMRSYALGDESALLMASYPHERPDNPFPYFTEVMTGFEYTAAIGMLYEGQLKNGLQTMRDIRNRYDGAKRSPFDEAECGHHYARAMVAWAGVLALTGFNYSGVTKSIAFAAELGTFSGQMVLLGARCALPNASRAIALLWMFCMGRSTSSTLG